MYRILRQLLFTIRAETAHDLAVSFLKFPAISRILGIFYGFDHPSLQKEVFGLRFRNPVGLAAGFDKNAEIIPQCRNLGFGFVEIGTVTPRPQPGNPKPRLFRLPADEALINRMGFNNQGVEQVVRNIKTRPPHLLIGGNVGKNKNTPNSEAFRDYEICFERLYDWVDFFVVNISSPNTPGLRELQEKEPLTELLIHLREWNRRQNRQKPVLLKIAPDLTTTHLDNIIRIVMDSGIDGLIATNTTVERQNLNTPLRQVEAIGEGGLSGKPLAGRSTEIIRYLHHKSGGAFPIIGVGGIHSPQDALEKLEAGASLIELYTGFIYEGPGLIKDIKKALVK